MAWRSESRKSPNRKVAHDRALAGEKSADPTQQFVPFGADNLARLRAVSMKDAKVLTLHKASNGLGVEFWTAHAPMSAGQVDPHAVLDGHGPLPCLPVRRYVAVLRLHDPNLPVDR